jgi:hypothetical protein
VQDQCPEESHPEESHPEESHPEESHPEEELDPEVAVAALLGGRHDPHPYLH